MGLRSTTSTKQEIKTNKQYPKIYPSKTTKKQEQSEIVIKENNTLKGAPKLIANGLSETHL